MQKDYNDMIDKKGKWIRYVFELTFPQSNETSDAFMTDLRTMESPYPMLDKFCEYVLNQHRENNATFPPNIWASHTALLHQTTDACESFHSHFNACFYKAHHRLLVNYVYNRWETSTFFLNVI